MALPARPILSLPSTILTSRLSDNHEHIKAYKLYQAIVLCFVYTIDTAGSIAVLSLLTPGVPKLFGNMPVKVL